MKPHLKVQVWIHCDAPGGRRFLVLRTLPVRGGFWQPVTGSVEPGEELEAAAFREASEESGLVPFPRVIAAAGPAFSFSSRAGKSIEEHPFHIELTSRRVAELPTPRLDSREHDAFRWATGEEALLAIRFDSNREVLRALMRRLDGVVPTETETGK